MGGGETCGTCGGMGETCCPDPTNAQAGLCGAGFQCNAGRGGGAARRTCDACGGKGQACCGTSPMVSMRTCATGACMTNGFCAN